VLKSERRALSWSKGAADALPAACLPARPQLATTPSRSRRWGLSADSPPVVWLVVHETFCKRSALVARCCFGGGVKV
jgi:hypothetical protein